MGRLEFISLCSVLFTLLLGNAIALGGLSPASEHSVRTLAALMNLATLVFFGVYFARSVRKVGQDMRKRRQPHIEMRTVRESVATNPLANGGGPGAAHRSSIL